MKIAVVTGTSTGIGLTTSLHLARNGYQVFAGMRNPAKAESLQQAAAAESLPIEVVPLDVCDSDSVASAFTTAAKAGPIDVLVNNAAVTPQRRQETAEGIELQFATNVMGYFWMTEAFTPQLRQCSHARVVNVASNWAGGLDIDDLEFKHRPYDSGLAYRQSKQANRMLTVAFADKLQSHGISVNACHPGEVNSKLSNNLGFGGHESPDQGARTPVWLATDRVGQSSTGRYFEYLRESQCRFSKDRRAIQQLYEACSRYS